MMSLNTILILIGILMLGSLLTSKISSRINMPCLLLFLAVGMLAKHVSSSFSVPSDTIVNYIGSAALAFILFSGGFDTEWKSVKKVWLTGGILSSAGVLLTAVFSGLMTWGLLHWTKPDLHISFAWCFLLGSIISSTDAAAVFSILRSKSVSLKGNLQPLLELESGSNDPMAAFLTIFLIELVKQEARTSAGPGFYDYAMILPSFVIKMGIGTLIGYLIGRFAVWLFNKIDFEYNGLYYVLAVVVILLTFSIGEFDFLKGTSWGLVSGNGFMAVYVAGIVMGNSKFVFHNGVGRFYDGFAWMMQVILFTMLGLLANPKLIISHAFEGLIFAFLLMFIARPLAVFLSMIKSPFSLRERLLVSWVGLRGGAPIMLATFPLLAGTQNKDILFNTVFFVVITSVLLQGMTIMPLAKFLKLDAPLKKRPREPLAFEETGDANSASKELVVPAQRAGMSLAELKLPGNTLVLIIRRDDRFIVPRGNTVLESGDELTDKGTPHDVEASTKYITRSRDIKRKGIPMLTNTFAADLPYLKDKFQKPVFDPASGIDDMTIVKNVDKDFVDLTSPRPVAKAKAFVYVCKNMQIDVSPHDFFPAFGCWKIRLLGGPVWYFRNYFYENNIIKNEELMTLLNETGVTRIWMDFDHSVPDWERNVRLGFPGMLKEVRRYRRIHEERGDLTPKRAAFFDGIEISYQAVLELLDRFIDYASHYDTERTRLEADCLKALRTREPRNTYEVLQFVYLYFIIGEKIDHFQVRSLGNLDNMLLPYVEKDLADGTFTEADVRLLLDHFLMQWGSINNYWGHPFYLGGTGKDGKSRINKVTYWILEEFEKLSIPSPKIQIKIAKNTPDEFLDFALTMIRRSHSSLVFIGEESLHRLIKRYGLSDEDARTCGISGCYEPFVLGKHHFNVTGCGHLNMLKPVDLILNGGTDPLTGKKVGAPVPPLSELKTFEDFYENYLQQLRWVVDANIKIVNEFERYLDQCNPSNIFSAAVELSLEKGEDAFATGCYGNHTTLLNAGFGTAVDALCALREFVYRRKRLTLEQLRDILNANWEGQEELRQECLRYPAKWGNGVAEADELAEKLSREVSAMIFGRPNSRGGIWVPSLHSARQFIEEGQKTGASPDGRFAREEFSKNASPTPGRDRNGITGLLRSAEHLDCRDFPGDLPLDVMLHPSTVSGEDGLAAWRALLRHYFAHNGLSVHFNIFDAETLKAAQKEPEKYSELQIRVCGWNVRYTTLDKAEQDQYIRRAENVAE